MKQKGPLAFSFTLKMLSEQGCLGVIDTGGSFEGTLSITVVKDKDFGHRGIDFEYRSELTPAEGKVVRLDSRALRLAESGVIPKKIEFQIPKITIPAHAQTYIGGLFTVRHWLRVAVRKTFGSEEFARELKSFVVTPTITAIHPFCVRVAVADSIRIDLMINRRKFEMGDVICGAAHFLAVNLKIKMFTVSLVAQELLEVAGKTGRHRHTIAAWEVTDGAPVRGEIVPFRLYLAPLSAWPSCSNVDRGYSVVHFLHFRISTMSGEKYVKDLQIKIAKWKSLPFTFTGQ